MNIYILYLDWGNDGIEIKTASTNLLDILVACSKCEYGEKMLQVWCEGKELYCGTLQEGIEKYKIHLDFAM